MQDLDDNVKLIFQDHASTDFGMVVQKPWDLIHPTADIDPTHIKGRNGDFLQNNQSYQNVTETFNLEILRPPEKGWFDWERAVTDWLSVPTDPDGRMKYQYLKFTADPAYVFKAIVKDPFTVTKDVTSDFVGICAIPFYCEPFQYRIDGIAYIPLPDSGIVVGEEKWSAIPDWHFIANGSFTLYVNGLPYTFENMEGEFWLSGETGDTYDAKGNLYNTQTHFPNLDPPKLWKGQNTITVTAETGTTITKAEYKPNWRRLI